MQRANCSWEILEEREPVKKTCPIRLKTNCKALEVKYNIGIVIGKQSKI